MFDNEISLIEEQLIFCKDKMQNEKDYFNCLKYTLNFIEYINEYIGDDYNNIPYQITNYKILDYKESLRYNEEVITHKGHFEIHLTFSRKELISLKDNYSTFTIKINPTGRIALYKEATDDYIKQFLKTVTSLKRYSYLKNNQLNIFHKKELDTLKTYTDMNLYMFNKHKYRYSNDIKFSYEDILKIVHIFQFFSERYIIIESLELFNYIYYEANKYNDYVINFNTNLSRMINEHEKLNKNNVALFDKTKKLIGLKSKVFFNKKSNYAKLIELIDNLNIVTLNEYSLNEINQPYEVYSKVYKRLDYHKVFSVYYDYLHFMKEQPVFLYTYCFSDAIYKTTKKEHELNLKYQQLNIDNDLLDFISLDMDCLSFYLQNREKYANDNKIHYFIIKKFEQFLVESTIKPWRLHSEINNGILYVSNLLINEKPILCLDIKDKTLSFTDNAQLPSFTDDFNTLNSYNSPFHLIIEWLDRTMSSLLKDDELDINFIPLKEKIFYENPKELNKSLNKEDDVYVLFKVFNLPNKDKIETIENVLSNHVNKKDILKVKYKTYLKYKKHFILLGKETNKEYLFFK